MNFWLVCLCGESSESGAIPVGAFPTREEAVAFAQATPCEAVKPATGALGVSVHRPHEYRVCEFRDGAPVPSAVKTVVYARGWGY